MATTTICNEGIINLIEAMCVQAHEDLAPKSYNLNLSNKKAFQTTMYKYKADKENATTAKQWLEYMKDVFAK